MRLIRFCTNYSLLPDQGDWLAGGTVEAAWSLGRNIIHIESDLAVKSWQECDLLERPIDELVGGATVKGRGNTSRRGVTQGPWIDRNRLTEEVAQACRRNGLTIGQ